MVNTFKKFLIIQSATDAFKAASKREIQLTKIQSSKFKIQLSNLKRAEATGDLIRVTIAGKITKNSQQ